jgi:hypothetical protein
MKLSTFVFLLVVLQTPTKGMGIFWQRLRRKTLRTEELISPAGERHSDFIVYANPDGVPANGTSVGLLYFDNDLVDPDDNNSNMGRDMGHCVQTYVGKTLDCYVKMDFGEEGSITAQAEFELPSFNAKLVITGGTDDYEGIVGKGTGTYNAGKGSVVYELDYKIQKF